MQLQHFLFFFACFLFFPPVFLAPPNHAFRLGDSDSYAKYNYRFHGTSDVAMNISFRLQNLANTGMLLNFSSADSGNDGNWSTVTAEVNFGTLTLVARGGRQSVTTLLRYGNASHFLLSVYVLVFFYFLVSRFVCVLFQIRFSGLNHILM